MVTTDRVVAEDAISIMTSATGKEIKGLALSKLSDDEIIKHVLKGGARGFARVTKFKNQDATDAFGTPNLVLLDGREFLAQKLADIPQQAGVDWRDYKIRYFGYGEGGAQEGTGTVPNKIGPFDDDSDLLAPGHFASESSDAATHFKYINRGKFKLIRSDNGTIKIESEDHTINKGKEDSGTSTNNATSIIQTRYTAIKYTMFIESSEFKKLPYDFNEAALYAVASQMDKTGVEAPKGNNVAEQQQPEYKTFARFTTATKTIEAGESVKIEWYILV